MAKSEEDIRQDIIYITRGTSYKNWQTGITKDSERRLSEHGKDQTTLTLPKQIRQGCPKDRTGIS